MKTNFIFFNCLIVLYLSSSNGNVLKRKERSINVNNIHNPDHGVHHLLPLNKDRKNNSNNSNVLPTTSKIPSNSKIDFHSPKEALYNSVPTFSLCFFCLQIPNAVVDKKFFSNNNNGKNSDGGQKTQNNENKLLPNLQNLNGNYNNNPFLGLRQNNIQNDNPFFNFNPSNPSTPHNLLNNFGFTNSNNNNNNRHSRDSFGRAVNNDDFSPFGAILRSTIG